MHGAINITRLDGITVMTLDL